MGHVEKLRAGQQLGRLNLIATHLLDAALNRIAVLRVLVLHDAHRYAVDHKHHVGAVALACWRFYPPLPAHMQCIRRDVVEINHRHAAVLLFGLVVPGMFPAQPRQQFTVALDAGRQRLQRVDHVAHPIFTQPRVELGELSRQRAAQEVARFPAAQVQRLLRFQRKPTDLHGVLHHRQLRATGFANF